MIWRHLITVIAFLALALGPWWLSFALIGAAILTIPYYFEAAILMLIFEWWYRTAPFGETVTWPSLAVATLVLVVIINKSYEHLRFFTTT